MSAPNVIVVLTDQLRAFEVGCYGNRVVRTPHLDALAAAGTRFELGVTNNPVCTPARSCLLSGQHSRTCTGEVGNVADDPPCRRRRRLLQPTVAECFRDAGYETALIGKWHVDPSPMLVGFEEAWYPLTIHRYVGQTYLENDVLGPVIEGYGPCRELARVSAFLERPRERPFFLFYNISLPHEPIGPAEMPPAYSHMYDAAQMPLRANVWRDGAMAHSERWFKVYQIWDYFWRLAGGPCWNAAPECGYPDAALGELPTDVLPDGFDLRDLYALYYGATSWVDDLLGGLLQTLRKQALDEDTIVLFLSDHGDNLGSHHLFNKDCLFEESIRVPWLIRGPGIANGLVNHGQIAQLIDVMPTLLDLCGLDQPVHCQGQSLAPVVRGDCRTLPQNRAFIETDPSFFGRPSIGVRTPTHLYGAFIDGAGQPMTDDCWGFYDLLQDPLQQRDLGATGEQPELAAELADQLRNWDAATPWLTVSDAELDKP